jgi:hypothetical protein
MKSILSLYLGYLETVVISTMLGAFILISVSGFLVGNSARIPATLALVTLLIIAGVVVGRRRTLKEHPELKNKSFGETRVFFTSLQNITALIQKETGKGVERQGSHSLLGFIGVAIIVALMTLTLWSSVTISANMANLRKNQTIIEATKVIPAFAFNRALIIEVKEVSNVPEPRVTAVIHVAGFSDININNEAKGYEIIIQANDQFLVRINDVTPTGAFFFIERISK